MMEEASPILIGNEADHHLRIVADAVRARGARPTIFDADSISAQGYAFSTGRLMIEGRDVPLGGRAWLRRIAPTRWTTGDLVGSVPDVSFRARVHLVASIARHASWKWLTTIDALQAAEDRLNQLRVAESLQIEVPATMVSSDPALARSFLGSEIVVKPIGTGAFVNEAGEPMTVHTTSLDERIANADFASAPFVAQKRIDVERHLRVVTFGNRASTAQLKAKSWPLDWRQAKDAHGSWIAANEPDVEAQAVLLANEMSVGFSSQDWLIPATGPPVFIDLNPAGQWMFLPPEIATPATDYIADFLVGET